MDHLVSRSWCYQFFWFFFVIISLYLHSSVPANQKRIFIISVMYPFLLFYVLMVCRFIFREKSVHHEEEYKLKFTLDIPKNGENQVLFSLSGDGRLSIAEMLCLYIQIVLILPLLFSLSVKDFWRIFILMQFAINSKSVLNFCNFFELRYV